MSRENGARLTKPEQPLMIIDFSERRKRAKVRMIEQFITSLAEEGMTFDEGYEILEYISETLLYRSRYVLVRQ